MCFWKYYSFALRYGWQTIVRSNDYKKLNVLRISQDPFQEQKLPAPYIYCTVNVFPWPQQANPWDTMRVSRNIGINFHVSEVIKNTLLRESGFCFYYKHNEPPFLSLHR